MLARALFAVAMVSAAELYRQGNALFQTGNFSAAAARFEQARLLAPDEVRILKALGASYAALNDYERANEPLGRACAIDPKLEDACYFYARSLYALNRFEPAIAELRKALRSDRQPWRIHLGVAQASQGLGQGEQAEAEFRKAVSLYEAVPANDRGRADFDPRLHYAVFLFRQGRLAEALAFARVVIRTWPNFGRGHYEAGRVLQHQGKLEEAADELEESLKGGGGAPAHLLLGRIYLRLGRTVEGERHLQAGSAAAH
jgi:tetratricopeptide (TPR) repeat protein